MRNLSALFIALSLAACGGSSATSDAVALDTTSGTEATEPTPSSEATAEAQPTGDAHFVMISVDQVAQRLDAQDARLAVFDANSAETFAEHHVPGATWVHYDAITADVLPTDHSASLVFYCANESCRASHTAAESAAALGYSDVSVMGAGIQGWVSAGKPVETGAPATP
jgi:3-mercaptopyruvate sulfurtransferase SseA